jgi:chromosome segregation ATPase
MTMNYESLTDAELIRIAEIDAKTPLELALLRFATGHSEHEERAEEAEEETEAVRESIGKFRSGLEDIRNDIDNLLSAMESA